MQLSVIILNYNAAPFLELCLQSVRAATKNMDAQVIVADNNSQDESVAMVRNLFPEVEVLAFTKNHGFSKGNNLAALHAQGDYLCVLNPDTVVPEDGFEKVLAFAKAYPQKKDQNHDGPLQPLGFIGVRLVDGSGTYLPESKRHIPTPIVARHKLLGNDKSYYYGEVGEQARGAVEILVGAFMFCHRDVFNDCGGFDERYFMYGEDIDLSYTALQNGYQNYYLGDISVLHFKGESTVKDKKYYERFYGAMGLFYDKYFKRNAFQKGLSALAVSFMVIFKSIQKQRSHRSIAKERIIVTAQHSWKSRFPNQSFTLTECQNTSHKQLLFDNYSYSYKEIIKFMSVHGNKFEYRFFNVAQDKIIGSNRSSCRGIIEDIH